MPHRSMTQACRRLSVPALLLSVGLFGCERQGAEEAETDAPAPPATDLQAPTDEGPGLPDAGDVARDAGEAARETADEVRRAAEEAREEAQRQAEEQAEQARQQAEETVEEVSQAARETMETYLGDLGALGEVLSGVNNQFSAASAAPKARSLIESLESSMEQLEQLAPEQFAQLKSTYAESLEPLVAKVRTEVNRLTSSDSFAALRPMLQDLPLLQP